MTSNRSKSKASARRPSRIAKAATADLRKLSPSENVRAGYSAKAERYVIRGKRVTKSTATISKRQYLERQTAERTGRAKASLEKAAQLRREGDLSYSSAASESQAAKTREVRTIKRSLREVERVRDLKGRSYQPHNLGGYMDLRRRKLAGEWLPDTDWFSLADVAEAINDPRLADLRRSAHVGPTA